MAASKAGAQSRRINDDYLEWHHVRELLEVAVERVLDARPADPLAAISETLLTEGRIDRAASRIQARVRGHQRRAGYTTLKKRDSTYEPAHVSTYEPAQLLLTATERERRGCTSPTARPDIFMADDVFAACDKTGKGELSVKELKDFLAPGYGEAEIASLLQGIEGYEQGKITRQQWRARFISNTGLAKITASPAANADAKRRLERHGSNLLGHHRPQMLTEERGITVGQLRDVYEAIEECCVRDGWTDIKGEPLAPERVVLYDCVRYLVKPCTAEEKISYVEFVATDKEAQRPKWFVSHWWGHPVLRTLRCIEQHAADHGYDEHQAYWVCAYAINQHDVSDDVRKDPTLSPFARAIELVEGRVLSIFDAEGVTLSRIWCCLEIYLGMAGTYEIYTCHEDAALYDLSEFAQISAGVAKEGFRAGAWLAEVIRRLPVKHGQKAVGITDGPVAVDRAFGVAPICKTFRESHFPVELIQKVSRIRIQDSSATVAEDKMHILNYIAGKRGEGLSDPVKEQCASYEEWNNALVCKHIAAAWRMLAEVGADMCYSGSLLADSSVAKLVLSFRGCDACNDAMAQLLAASLPRPLQELSLELKDSHATDAGGRAVLDGLCKRVALGGLRILHMHDCLLTGRIPEAFGACTSLTMLDLAGNQLSGELPAAVLARLPSLVTLLLQNNQLCGPLPETIGCCTKLVRCCLNGNTLTGKLPAALGSCGDLNEFRAQANLLEGPLPEALGRCVALEALQVDPPLLAAPHGLPAALEARKQSGALLLNRPRGASRVTVADIKAVELTEASSGKKLKSGSLQKLI